MWGKYDNELLKEGISKRLVSTANREVTDFLNDRNEQLNVTFDMNVKNKL